jgi:nuclear pore complex protein Nup62
MLESSFSPFPSAPSLFSLGGAGAAKEADKSKDSAATATAAPTGTSTAVAPVPPPSMLRGKTIEEIVNRWSTDLETHIKEFNKYAAEVAVWDRALIENSNNVG